MNNEEEREFFVTAVRKSVCEKGRGNIFANETDNYVREALPSFWEVLKLALRLDEKSDEDVAIYEHDFDKMSLEDKARFELKAAAQ